ncbi:MAG TPA: arsenate reductase [Cytophagales bacterium]|nr:arsenate reductase [Cytophagales bacterium]
MYKIYGIPNCDTVKKSLNWLKAHNIPYEFHDYKKEGITKEKLEEWLRQYPWDEVLNRKSTTWKELTEEEKPKDANTAIQLMMQKTSVIKRPIVESQRKIMAIGFNEDNFKKLS